MTEKISETNQKRVTGITVTVLAFTMAVDYIIPNFIERGVYFQVDSLMENFIEAWGKVMDRLGHRLDTSSMTEQEAVDFFFTVNGDTRKYMVEVENICNAIGVGMMNGNHRKHSDEITHLLTATEV